jgi:muramoyltetrapeptide carboxypeptidase
MTHSKDNHDWPGRQRLRPDGGTPGLPAGSVALARSSAESGLMSHRQADRIHLIAHAGPAHNDLRAFGFRSGSEYLRFIRARLPANFRLTCCRRLLEAAEDEWHGGRCDDAARIRDLQEAISDPSTLALVAVNGGAYFSRILPHVDFSPLSRRRRALYAVGFSELSTLVNVVASYRCGRGLYWLCPNYLVWKLRPRRLALRAFEEFWRLLPEVLAGRTPQHAQHLHLGPIRAELVSGRVRAGRINLIGGCLSVLAAVLAGAVGRRLRPEGKWLFIEDIQEVPYRVDRHLAAFKVAGWFERIAGLLVGDFHTTEADVQPAVLELLRFHLPRDRKLPIAVTRDFGHVWPMVPVWLGRPLRLEVQGRRLSISAD